MSEDRLYYGAGNESEIAAALRANVKIITKGIRGRSFTFEDPGPEVIDFLMQMNGWTQTFVARMLRCNVSTVRRWTAESDQSQFSKIPYSQWLLLLIFAGLIVIQQEETPVREYI